MNGDHWTNADIVLAIIELAPVVIVALAIAAVSWVIVKVGGCPS